MTPYKKYLMSLVPLIPLFPSKLPHQSHQSEVDRSCSKHEALLGSIVDVNEENETLCDFKLGYLLAVL